MNNALLQESEEAPDLSNLQERKVLLFRLVEAIDKLSKNEAWHTLKELVFDGQVDRLEKSLLAEAKLNELNAPKIYRLQGNLEWAKRWDLYKQAETYKKELNGLTKKLNENAPI